MLPQNWTDKMHIQINNDMVDDKSTRRATVDELYIYSLLSIKSYKDYSITASVDFIAHVMQTEHQDGIRFAARDNDNKIKIRQALKGLIDKGYLIPVHDVDVDDIKNNTFITMTTENLEKNFTKIFYNEFRMMRSTSDLFIFTTVKRYSEPFKGSYSRWAKLLNVSNKTAVSRLNEAEYKTVIVTDKDGNKIERQKGVVHITRGKFETVNRQENNLYHHVDFMKMEEVVEEPEGVEEEIEETKQVDKQIKAEDEATKVEPKKESKVIFAFGTDKKENNQDDKQNKVNEQESKQDSMSIKEKIGDSLPF